MSSSRCICDWMVDCTLDHMVSNAAGESREASCTYHDVFTCEGTRVWYAAFDVRTPWNLIAQPHCDMAQQRRVEEPIIALLRLVLVEEIVLFIVVVVSCELKRTFDILQGAYDVVVLP